MNDSLKCFLCNNEEKDGFLSLHPDFCSTHNYICKKCGLVFIPRKNETFQDYYQKDGYYKESPNIGARKQLISKTHLISIAENKIGEINKLYPYPFSKETSIIDIGCGYGENVYVLSHRFGCNAIGLEASQEASELGKRLFSIPIETMLLENLSTTRLFDFIICSHILEHVTDPELFLKNMSTLMQKNGVIYLETPNIIKPSGGFTIEAFLYNEHIQTFSVTTLTRLIEKVGLNMITYSDNDFLRFIISKQGVSPKITIPDIHYNEVIDFLDCYQKNYSLQNHISVFLNKMLYAIDIFRFKVKDVGIKI